MKTLQITGYGNIKSNLDFFDIEKPSISNNEVLIEVHAAGINPIDYKIIQGAMKSISKLNFPAPIGFDVSGKLVAVGDAVKHLEVGDEVYSRIPTEKPGSFSEFIAVDSTVIVKKPKNISFEDAAGIPLIGLTTVQAFERVELKDGDKVLIHAGSGGVGSFAIQYAKSKGAHVTTTTSTKNVSWVKELGADIVIDYKEEDYLNCGIEFDIVFDTLGGNYTADAFQVLKEGGKVVSISGDLDEESAKQLGLNSVIRFILKLKRKKITKLAHEKSAKYCFIFMQPNAVQLNNISSLIESKSIKAITDTVFAFKDSIEAIDYVAKGRAKGKVVLKMK